MAEPRPAPKPASGSDDTTQRLPPPARYLGGRYRLERTLGRGAMGRVWAAYDESLHRWVAVKEVDFPAGVPVSEQHQVAERAMREARAIASVSDPHVVTIFDLVAGPAIVMELLDARALAQILAEDGPLDEMSSAIVGFGVASGLLAAHTAGVTHRDVKPGNVLICRDGRIKLTDFGIARSVSESTLTATGLLLGSPAYISPEVANGSAADPGSDAWGLGALLFACVQGRPPFDQGNPLKTLVSVVNDPVPPHHMAGRLGPLIDGLLVKDPRRRMTVGAALDGLRPLVGDRGGLRLTHQRSTTRTAGDQWRTPTPIQPLAAVPAARPLAPAAELPPPPWAGRSTSTMAALPAQARRRRPASHWMVAFLVGLLAAAAGFFGVRAVATLTTSTTPAVTSSSAPGPSFAR